MVASGADDGANHPSMKVPPKRKGNWGFAQGFDCRFVALNESPSEKEGKCAVSQSREGGYVPSMKVPPKRKGNCRGSVPAGTAELPQ